ncbi:hypothetical protein H4582DRAFT_2126015 [Lactarius indigo]|nr:hypothetical protein H4582DRAFT_2126015 [Lactarius indigo]
MSLWYHDTFGVLSTRHSLTLVHQTVSTPSTRIDLPFLLLCPKLPETTSPSSNIESIFDAALKSYKKKTKKDLKKHESLQTAWKIVISPATILAVFQVDPFRIGGDDRSKKWFLPTVNVLYAFSTTLSEGVGLVNINPSIFSLAKVVFAGFGILLLLRMLPRAKTPVADIFGRIESFFGRLEVYTEFPLTAAMTNKMVQITVEVLGILATATKEMKRGLAKKFVKRIAGKTDLEDGLKKLDTLTNEEVVMASAQLLKITHNIDNKVTGVGDGVRCVDEKTGKEVKAIATKVKSIVQQTADDVDDVKRS